MTPAIQELIKAEKQKANDEIKLWIQLQNDWFYYKFLLVRAVVAILVGFAKLNREKEPDKDFAEVFMSEVSCLICAVGVSLRSPSTCISGTTSSSSTELVIYAPAHRRSGDTHSFTTFLKIS